MCVCNRFALILLTILRCGSSPHPGTVGFVAPRSIVLVRHAEPLVSMAAPRSEWSLTDAGHRAASELGVHLRARWADRTVAASTEIKAIETAGAIASPSTPVLTIADLGEVASPWFTNREDHRAATVRYLDGDALDGWEPASAAVTRFGAALESLAGDTAIVVSHGTVMSLWLRSVDPDIDAVAFWHQLTLPDAWFVDLRRGTVDRVAT
jgi:broad specificity phosphatase PhoE